MNLRVHIQTIATMKAKSAYWFGNHGGYWYETSVEGVQWWKGKGGSENNIASALQKFSLEGDLKLEYFLLLCLSV